MGVLLGVVGFAACKPASSPVAPQAASKGSEAVVATVLGTPITEAQLDELSRGGLRRVDYTCAEQRHEVRLSNLDKLLVQHAIEGMAALEKMSPEEVYKREVLDGVAEATDEEVSEMRVRMGLADAPAESIRGMIREQRVIENGRAFLSRLRKAGKLELKIRPFVPPRVEVTASGPAIGPEDAAVRIVAFTRYPCRECAELDAALQRIVTESDGQVRLTAVDVASGGQQKAVEAAHCAGDQGKYWQMRAKLFAVASEEPEALGRLAGEVGLDRAKFDECLRTGAKAELTQKAFRESEATGIVALPSIFINGLQFPGPRPYEVLQGMVAFARGESAENKP